MAKYINYQAKFRIMSKEDALKKRILRHKIDIDATKKELAKVLIGQDEIVNTMFKVFLSNGSVLVEGVPGIAKTLMIRALSQITSGSFGRIQFTPDLLPTDIIGITTYQEKKGFNTIKGPIFNNFVLGDEINRAPPKVQSALLQAMQERQATISNITYDLPRPFFVMATQNPIETVGTYPLPEAQLDRFIFKILMGYPTIKDEKMVLKTNISTHQLTDFKLKKVLDPARIVQMQDDVKLIYLDEKLEDYIVKITDSTRNPDTYDLKLGKYIQWGASPRASIAMYIAAKAGAFLEGKTYVSPHDIRDVVASVLRHRIIINYEGQAAGIKPEDIIEEILKKVPVP